MKLTPREKDVMCLIAQGFGDKEVAFKLNLSARTVQTHIGSVIKKYDARNRINAVAIYVKSKYRKIR